MIPAMTVRGTGQGVLHAGATRADITPPANAALVMNGFANRTQGFRVIHDRIYVLAIVLDDGTTQSALVVWELLLAPDSVWTQVSLRIVREAGVSSRESKVCQLQRSRTPIALDSQW
jgi:hypothetical protein